jgi:hypothetical protein
VGGEWYGKTRGATRDARWMRAMPSARGVAIEQSSIRDAARGEIS